MINIALKAVFHKAKTIVPRKKRFVLCYRDYVLKHSIDNKQILSKFCHHWDTTRIKYDEIYYKFLLINAGINITLCQNLVVLSSSFLSLFTSINNCQSLLRVIKFTLNLVFTADSNVQN